MDPFTQPGAFSWCELLTTDPEAAQQFYGELFGWTLKPSDIADMPYTTIEVDGQGIGGIASLPPNAPNMPPAWGAYVTVTDVDETLQKAQALGGKVLMPAMDIPSMGRFALIQDLQGAALGVISYVDWSAS
ncbi:MAG: VOC family protein [Spirulinaceae cyanobacterium SM2_1_0]|nr:VOC family protein [Spirulinaceae cyanobacterium SM2_1_0]